MHTQTVCSPGTLVYFSPTGERLLTVTTVARIIQRTPRMVRYLAVRGQIPAFKKGKLWYFKKCDVEYYFRSLERRYV